MENKYFIPDIEDIRVGYECESHEWSMDEAGIPELNYNRWIKITLNKNYVKTLLEYGIRGIRVPYLTKEQIEAEGWGNVTHHWKKGNFNLLPPRDDDEWNIRIFKETTCVFDGTCKDINTFRYIFKLLNINK